MERPCDHGVPTLVQATLDRHGDRDVDSSLDVIRAFSDILGCEAICLAYSKTPEHVDLFSFIYQLHCARHLDCMDPRDKVFAFLDHFSFYTEMAAFRESLRADYIASETEIYMRVATAALLYPGSEPLIVLAAVQRLSMPFLSLRGGPIPLVARGSSSETASIVRFDPTYTEHRLPTWVPDWTADFGIEMLSRPTSPHRAGYINENNRRSEVHIVSDGVIRIRGVRVDWIAETWKLDTRTSMAENVCEIWKKLISMAPEDQSKFRTGEREWLLALLQTLSNGCVLIARNRGDEHHYSEIPKTEWFRYGLAWLVNSGKAEMLESAGVLPNGVPDPDIFASDAWYRAAHAVCHGRRFGITRRGFCVLGPEDLAEGDTVAILLGGKTPFCPREFDGGYLLVGESYVYGFMNGEALKETTGEEFIDFDIF
ncbi:hypothetical protein E0Z10_g9635 [Xylaria hypoxylon]|uniref:Heterokaryon incompatibility domain-containing protein n=1 Tax=Xylaria hypoxylon TaxID=37992 RepID=A0A4Z0YIL8_9PEZI|nr:hypothetical protein E0Z10_g9635 [Xylaria hypoxylon]